MTSLHRSSVRTWAYMSISVANSQVPSWEGKDPFTGKLGDTISLEQGKAAARLCAIDVLAHVSAILDGELGGGGGPHHHPRLH